MSRHFRWSLAALSVIAAATIASRLYEGSESRALQEKQSNQDNEFSRRKRIAQERSEHIKRAAASYDASGIRLTDLEQLPENQRTLVRTIIASLSPSDAKPEEYIAHVVRDSESYELHLRHENHATDYEDRGDSCGKCRSAVLNPKTGAVRIYGIR